MGLLCTNCKAQWKGNLTAASLRVKCPKCGHELTASTVSAPTEAIAPGLGSPTAGLPVGRLVRRRIAPAKAVSTLPPRPRLPAALVAGVGAGVVLLLLIVVAVLAANSGGDAPKPQVVQQDNPPPVDALPPGAGNLEKPKTNPPAENNIPRPAEQNPPRPGEKDNILPTGPTNPLPGGKDNVLPPDDLNGDDQVPEQKNPQTSPPDKTSPLVLTLPVPPKDNNATLVIPDTSKPGTAPGAVVNVEFMGTQAKGKRFCYICDRSGSMNIMVKKWNPLTQQPVMVGPNLSRINALKQELAQSLASLPQSTEFCVIFFDSVCTLPPWGVTWKKGGTADVPQMIGWINTITARGGTLPGPAFEYAFLNLNPRPDVIFFMTDGGIPNNVPMLVAQLNASQPKKVVVNTIMFGSPLSPFAALNPLVLPPNNYLRKLYDIAQQSGGAFRDFHYILK